MPIRRRMMATEKRVASGGVLDRKRGEEIGEERALALEERQWM